ncbi:hypothetical protein H7X46_06245 [Pseudonocardia sp. C8]|uniref:hypothetical protein n=1 Tax=Pseudonocardia sp. C8 TaxID=2762759 RepID=UPI001642CA76|nr:hypothetical protein [Pseudonocardia sp. C8]MBC3190663.1 hypothetical protein [Pseudonocardia sp. C8]
MAELHIKGYILQLMARNGAMWDDDIARDVLGHYGLSGDYWYGTVRVTLTDLFSGGLLDELDTTVDPDRTGGKPKLLFKFAVNDFGRERMAQTGLLEATP